MPREQQAWRARGLGGQAEATGCQRRLDLDFGQGRDQRAAFQPFFQSPGGVLGLARLHHEKKRRVEAEHHEARSIRLAPFARGRAGEAPQHEIAAPDLLGRLLGDHGKGETQRRRTVAIGLGPDVMEAPGFQPAQGKSRRRGHLFLTGRSEKTWWRRKKRAGGAGRGRARCGGACQRHGNLLERADLRAQMLNQEPRPSPACFCNASRWN